MGPSAHAQPHRVPSKRLLASTESLCCKASWGPVSSGGGRASTHSGKIGRLGQVRADRTPDLRLARWGGSAPAAGAGSIQAGQARVLRPPVPFAGEAHDTLPMWSTVLFTPPSQV